MASPTWTCSKCHTINPAHRPTCRSCNYKKADQQKNWICPDCGTVMSYLAVQCRRCNTPKPPEKPVWSDELVTDLHDADIWITERMRRLETKLMQLDREIGGKMVQIAASPDYRHKDLGEALTAEGLQSLTFRRKALQEALGRLKGMLRAMNEYADFLTTEDKAYQMERQSDEPKRTGPISRQSLTLNN